MPGVPGAGLSSPLMGSPPATASSERLRLDKWLWAARFFRTRSLATQAIQSGRVAVNNSRPKPSRVIGVGDQVAIQRPPYTWTVEVLALSEQRGPAPVAALLYRETSPSIAARERIAVQEAAARAGTPDAAERPNKRQRRAITRFIQRLEDSLE